MKLRDRGISSHERGPRISSERRAGLLHNLLSAEGVEWGVLGEVHLFYRYRKTLPL